MKNLKLMTVTTAFVFAGFLTVNAQDAAHHQAHTKGAVKKERIEKIEEMKAELNLTDEQVEKIKAIHAKNKAERQANKEKIQEINKAEKEEINQVLTEEQKAILKAKRQERKQERTIKKEKPAEKVVAPKN